MSDEHGLEHDVEALEGEDHAAVVARTFLRPTIQSAVTIRELTGQSLPGVEFHALVDELRSQVDTALSGDSARSEAMLLAQAHTLDAIFHATTRYATRYMGQHSEVVERYLKLAMKAQTQCQITLEAVSNSQNPSIVVKQSNIAHGPQQVNNYLENELLERNDGEWMDTGAPNAASDVDSELEAVGAVNRAEDK